MVWLFSINSLGGEKYCTLRVKSAEKKKFFYSDENWYSGVFAVADYESSLQIPELKMADPIWRIKM